MKAAESPVVGVEHDSGVAKGHPRRWWILGVLCLSLFMVVVDNTIVNVALPTLSTELGASITSLQWIVDAYTLVFSALLLAFGYFGDRFGRTLALRLGLIIFGLTSMLAAFSTTTSQLIGARALMGIGAALIFPATLAIIINVFTDIKERAAAIGIWSGVTGLAVAAGPVTGGLLLEHFWWGSLFLVNLPIVVVALVLGGILVPNSRDPQPGRFDRLGVVLSVAAVALVIWSIIEGPHRGWSSAEVVITGTLGAVLVAIFVVYEARRDHPLLDVRLFTNPRFSAASIAIAAAFFGLFGFIFLITQYMQLVLGYSPLEAGVRTVPFAVVTGAFSPASIAIMHRLGTKAVVTAGLALMSAGFVMASQLQADSAYVGPVLASMVVIAAGLGLTTSPATEAIMGALPPAKAGVGSAVNDTTRELGGTLGVALVGSVFASLYSPAVRDTVTGLPQELRELISESIGAAVVIAPQLPNGDAVLAAARDAFMTGFASGSLVAAAATGAGAVAALVWLPARARAEANDTSTRHPSEVSVSA
jgi:EmrB/QacA subfamily drug resistance transporter